MLRICTLIVVILSLNSFFPFSLHAQNNFNGQVWYQIFPERFANGSDENNPTAEHIGEGENWEISRWTKDWYQREDWEQRVSTNFYDFATKRRYGGDLVGVVQKLDYLKSLGVDVIYFNPVFDARTMHKYDATHYRHIDRFFGTDPAKDTNIIESEKPADPETWQWTTADSVFLNLIEEAHSRNIKIVIDGVFNHTGREFWAFQDIIKHQEKSEFADWYDVISFDDSATEENEFDYHGWWGYKGLPEFKESDENMNPGPKQHIFEITRRWMDPNGDGNPEDGIDGWRLDMAEDVSQNFWLDWHKLVRDINPEAITVAEVWDDRAVLFIKEYGFDAVMNYRFTKATHKFFIKQETDANTFRIELTHLLNDFDHPTNLKLLNMMDSHDTERLASMIVNRNRDFKEGSKIRQVEDTYDVRKPNESEIKLQKVISAFQFMWTGSPMIYYGTEAGMWGADDPDDRKPMVWPELEYDDEMNHPFSRYKKQDKVSFNHDLHQHYQQLAELRKSEPPIIYGEVTVLHAAGDLLAFERSITKKDSGEKASVIFVANRSAETKSLTINHAKHEQKTITKLLGNTLETEWKEGGMHIKLAPFSFTIYKFD